jgi:hypothetical protein
MLAPRKVCCLNPLELSDHPADDKPALVIGFGIREMNAIKDVFGVVVVVVVVVNDGISIPKIAFDGLLILFGSIVVVIAIIIDSIE